MMKSGANLKFAVLQAGARMHYAIPSLLHYAGMLQVLYTDAVGNVGILNVASHLIPAFVRAKPLRRLFGRRLPAAFPHDAVVSAPARTVAHAMWGRLPASARDLLPLQCPEAWMRKQILADGFRGANALYSFDNGDLEVIREAKRRGMVVVYEQVICPDVGRILRQERALFPGIELQDSEELVESGIRRDLEVWNLSDVVLAASDFVRDSLIRLGCPADRIALVPYGLHDDWMAEPVPPVPGRVLFVGSVGLRKGNHYFAEACRLLRDRGVQTDFRVVGPFDRRGGSSQSEGLASPIFEGPHYVGQVPRAQVREEFARADVFAFPTVAEGFGLAHLEALACGVPVVTTPNCGSVVRDGVDGFVVPIRDTVALADRIQQIVLDRALRERMSRNARERAAQYSWKHYSEALLGALQPLG
jgi:hypothetical protein